MKWEIPCPWRARTESIKEGPEEVRSRARARFPGVMLMPLPLVQELLTPEQRRFAVRGVPTLLEVSGFSYFYGAFMVGPQFSMTDYQKLARGEMTDVQGQRPNR